MEWTWSNQNSAHTRFEGSPVPGIPFHSVPGRRMDYTAGPQYASQYPHGVRPENYVGSASALYSPVLQCHTENTSSGDIQILSNATGDPVATVDLRGTQSSTSQSETSHASTPTLTYSVKILNPSKKTDFIIQKLRISRHFTSVDDLKAQIISSCEGKVPEDLEQLGYMSPGSQKKRWVFTDDDIKDMYDECSGKREILLWCHGKGKPDEGKTSKRSFPDSDTGTKGSKVPRTSNYEIHRQKLDEVQEIKEDLSKRHAGRYTPEQLGAWAHLLQMGRHDSRDTPPDLPYWKKREKKSKNSLPSTTPIPGPSSLSSSVSGSISPGKRITLRGHCVDQLAKWHDLLEKGAISQEQYDEIQSSIMLDVKTFQ